MRHYKHYISIAALAGIVIFGITTNQPAQRADTFSVSQSAEQHILHGDARGGGHLFGTGKPCKSEFPEDWDEEDVISTVSRLAANDNANWRQEKNGYYVSEQMQQDVRVRIVMNNDKTEIVTAYPVNVERNPCPKAANDN